MAGVVEIAEITLHESAHTELLKQASKCCKDTHSIAHGDLDKGVRSHARGGDNRYLKGECICSNSFYCPDIIKLFNHWHPFARTLNPTIPLHKIQHLLQTLQ